MRVRGLVTCAAFAAAVSLVGCGGGDKPAAAPPSSAPAATPAAAAAPPAATASGFGVPECDEYMTKYLACIDSKVPEAARAMVRQGLDQTKASWQQAAATPQGKQGLAAGCKQATEAAKQAMAAYGCSW